MSEYDEPLIEYPRDFPITVIGRNEEDFRPFVVDILKRFSPGLEEEKVFSRLSRNGNYLSVRATFFAVSRQHVEEVYRELTSHQRVIIVL